jgi:hypothetical protein
VTVPVEACPSVAEVDAMRLALAARYAVDVAMVRFGGSCWGEYLAAAAAAAGRRALTSRIMFVDDADGHDAEDYYWHLAANTANAPQPVRTLPIHGDDGHGGAAGADGGDGHRRLAQSGNTFVIDIAVRAHPSALGVFCSKRFARRVFVGALGA